MFRHRACLVAAILTLVPPTLSSAQSEGPDSLYRQGVGQFAAGNYAEAARNFSELIKHFGAEPDLKQQLEGAYYAYGCSLYNLGQFAEAIEIFKQYIELYPQALYRDEGMYRIGSAHQSLEAYDAAVAAYGELMRQYPRSDYSEDAAFQIGMCRLLQEKPNDAIVAFKDFIQAYPDSEFRGQAAAFAARALFDTGKLAEAVEMLRTVEARPVSWNVITYCNFLAFEIGDAAFDNTEYELALKAYRRVRTRQALLRRQAALVAGLAAELEAFRNEKPKPEEIKIRFRRERRLTGTLAQARELLQKLEALPDYDAALFHRIGRCFFNTDRYWEARVAFTRVVEVATEETMREAAHFDLVLVISRLRRFDDLIEEASRYLTRYDPEWKKD